MHDESATNATGAWVRAGRSTNAAAPRRAGLVAAAVLLAAGVFTLRSFLPALAWAVIFAVGLWPWFDRLAQRWPSQRRTTLPALVVVAIVVLCIVPVALIAVPLVSDAQSAMQWLSDAQHYGMSVPGFVYSLPFGTSIADAWQRELGQPGGVSSLANHAVQGGLVHAGRAIGASAAHRLVLISAMLLTLFFLLRSAPELVQQLRIGSRRAFGRAGEDVGRQMILSVHGTINGLVLVGLAEGVLMGITYALAGVPHPTLFGLLTALLAMVPFGAAIAFGLVAVVLLANSAIAAAIVVLAIGMVVLFIADHFVRPALIGGATRLPFIWVLLGILGGVEAWGLIGLFLGPALMAALILLWRQWVGAQKGPINPTADQIPPPVHPAPAHAPTPAPGHTPGHGTAPRVATAPAQAQASQPTPPGPTSR